MYVPNFHLRAVALALLSTAAMAVILIRALGPAEKPVTAPASYRAGPPAVAGSLAVAGVCSGLDAVNPAAYGGWRGDCPGAALDAWLMHTLLESYGHGASLLIDAAATRAGIIAAGRAAVKSLAYGGCLWITVSGHGSRTHDTSGDEADGWDEQICLWDGRINDDDIWLLLQEIAGKRPDLHVFMLSDTCHSGGNFRGGPIELAGSRSARALDVSLVHFAGSPPDKYAYGSAQGGVFTTALIDTFDTSLSYAEWFRRAAALMPANQRPVMETIGRPFAHRPLFDFPQP